MRVGRLIPSRSAACWVVDGRADLRCLAGLLNAPLRLVELAPDATPVYHLAVGAATVGVGEHSPVVRRRAAERLSFLGVAFDHARNAW